MAFTLHVRGIDIPKKRRIFHYEFHVASVPLRERKQHRYGFPDHRGKRFSVKAVTPSAKYR
jgi:hypothetical protein